MATPERHVGRRIVPASVAIAGLSERAREDSNLAGYLGLVPSERSSGEWRRQGQITTAESSHARRLLVEAAWHYRLKRPRRPAATRAPNHSTPKSANGTNTAADLTNLTPDQRWPSTRTVPALAGS